MINRRIGRSGSGLGLVWIIGIPLVIVVTVVVLLVMKIGGDKWFGDHASGEGVEPTRIEAMEFSTNNWSYDRSNNVYYQIKVRYVLDPVSDDYETLGIYVPGEYLSCVEKDSKYECAVDASGTLNDYTAMSAPIVMPIDASEYEAVKSPGSYNYKTASEYVRKGFIYVYVGHRGRIDDRERENIKYAMGAPWGAVDLKAAVRFIRYQGDKLPGNKNAVIMFGVLSGGGLASLLGASGDNPLFSPYLEKIGARMAYDDGTPVSDAINGVSVWSPLTEFATADAAYEWSMGQYIRDPVDTKAKLTEDLAGVFVDYVNKMGFSKDGVPLRLDSVTSGSYYDYIIGEIEKSLNNYLEDKYELEEDRSKYIEKLGEWAKYENGTARIEDFAGFVKSRKSAVKSVPAFDALDRSAAENELFASGDNKAMHFDDYLSDLVYANHYDVAESDISGLQEDMSSKNEEGTSQRERVLMYTPTVYLMDYYNSVLNNLSIVASNWRIRTGLSRSDSSMTTEVNLALALSNYPGVSSMDYEMVWGEGQAQAERKGNGTDSFISWVESITK